MSDEDEEGTGIDLELLVPAKLLETTGDHVGYMVGVLTSILDGLNATSEKPLTTMYFLEALAMQYLAKASRRDVMQRLSPAEQELYLKLEKVVETQLLTRTAVPVDVNRH